VRKVLKEVETDPADGGRGEETAKSLWFVLGWHPGHEVREEVLERKSEGLCVGVSERQEDSHVPVFIIWLLGSHPFPVYLLTSGEHITEMRYSQVMVSLACC